MNNLNLQYTDNYSLSENSILSKNFKLNFKSNLIDNEKNKQLESEIKELLAETIYQHIINKNKL